MKNKIYYSVENNEERDIRVITLYHDNKVLAELDCYNDFIGDWEEIDMFLEENDLYDVYGEDVEFVEL